jgi:hypothetical protein
MKPHKEQIGVCMDDHVAFLLQQQRDENVITIISSEEMQEECKRKDHTFYKKVFEALRDFEAVHLFGPKAAKDEIVRRIKSEKLSNIKVVNGSADEKMNDKGKIAFINNFFGVK